MEPENKRLEFVAIKLLNFLYYRIRNIYKEQSNLFLISRRSRYSFKLSNLSDYLGDKVHYLSAILYKIIYINSPDF